MLHKEMIAEIVVDNNRKLRIYDNVLDMQYRHDLYRFALASKFGIGWADGPIAENQKYQFLHSVYNEADLERLQIIERLQNTPVAQEMVGFTLTKCILNLSTPSDANFTHAHPEDKIILCYINLEWHDGWHGETLFFDESGKDIMFASAYTPGRIIVFDPKIPHTIRPQSHIATGYRFTLALIFTKC